MDWLLVLMVANPAGGVSTTVTQVFSKEVCEAAGRAAVDEFRSAEMRVRFVCVKR